MYADPIRPGGRPAFVTTTALTLALAAAVGATVGLAALSSTSAGSSNAAPREATSSQAPAGQPTATSAASPAAATTPSGSQPARDWLADERKSEARREERQRVDDIFAALGITSGSHVADIGAGRGFFSVRMARQVGPTGRVLAVDVDPKSLERLRERIQREGISNIDVLQGTQEETRLPAQSLDAALIVNAYHEMPQYDRILAQIRQALKPQAPLVIVEPLDTTLRDAPRAQQTPKHVIGSDHVVRELREAGFTIASLQDPFIQRGSIDEEWLVVARAPAAAQDPVAQRLSQRTRIHLDEFKALYDNADVLVLDVRDPESYREGHIPGALLLTEDKFAQHLDMLRAEPRLIVAYCSCPAEETSGSAVTKLSQLGLTNAKALVGGYRLWKARKHPIATGDAPCDGPLCPLKPKTVSGTTSATSSAPRP